MYCSFCGKEIRDESTFCTQCGKNQTTGKMKSGETTINSMKINLFLKNKKVVVGIIIAVLIVLISSNFLGSKSVVGNWVSVDGNKYLTFDRDGTFEYDGSFGSYEIYDNEISMNFKDIDMMGTNWTVKYGEEALDEDNTKYWYRVGNILFFKGTEYEKVR